MPSGWLIPARTRTHKRQWVKRSIYRRKQHRNITPIIDDKCVVNLSFHILSEPEVLVLSCWTKFVPTITSVEGLELRTYLDKFAWRLCLKVPFHKDNKEDDIHTPTSNLTADESLLNHPFLKKFLLQLNS